MPDPQPGLAAADPYPAGAGWGSTGPWATTDDVRGTVPTPKVPADLKLGGASGGASVDPAPLSPAAAVPPRSNKPSGPTGLANDIVGAQGPLTPEIGRRSGIRAEYVPVINWIAKGEARSYNQLYREGQTFSDMSDHPANLGWKGDIGPDGRPTHAAGLLQWEPATWNEARAGYNKLHPDDQVHDFSDVSQNKVGQYWIDKTYREKTGGRDIIQDLYAGKTDMLVSSLRGQWPSLGKGSDREQFHYGLSGAAQQLAAEQRASTDKEVASLESQRQNLLAEASQAAPGTARRMEMLEKANERAARLTDLYEQQSRAAPTKQPTDIFAGFGGIVLALAAFAGGKSRQPLTASLNAMSGAIDAMNEGNEKDFQNRMKIWEKQTDYALKAVELQNKNIHNILADQTLADREKQARLNTYFKAAELTHWSAQLEAGNMREVWNMLQASERNAEAARHHQEQMNMMMLNYDQRERLAGERAPEERKYIEGRVQALGPEATEEQKNTERLAAEKDWKEQSRAPTAAGTEAKLLEEQEAARNSGDEAKIKAAEQKIADYNKIHSRNVGRTPQAIYAAKVMEENPHISAEGFAEQMGEFRRIQALEGAFAGGVIGRQIISLNTVSDHILRVQEAWEALNNKDFPKFNAIANRISKETGGPEVTNFEIGRDVMADEIVRLLTSTGGTEADRKGMQDRLSRDFSPAQIAGAIETLKEFTGARFDSLKQQYAQNNKTREDRFTNELLTDKSRQVYGGGASAGGIPEVTKDQYDNLRIGKEYRMPGDPPGTYRVKQ